MEEDLKMKVEELEEELENKEIMINALLNEIKKLKGRDREVKRRKITETEAMGVVELVGNECNPTVKGADSSVDTTKQESAKHESSKQESAVTTQSDERKANQEVHSKPRKRNLKEEVDNLIHHNRTNKTFKDSSFIEDFLDYCADTIPYNFNTSCWELKGPIKAYVGQNLFQITSFISREVNRLSLLQICSTLHCITGALTPLESAIVFHDILLMIDDYSKLHFIFHSLFKSRIDDFPLGSTILSIMSYQQKVDSELLKPRKALLQHISSLKYSFEIPRISKRLEDILVELTTPLSIFKDNMIDEDIYQHLFAIRMLTHFLDWDYTFNIYVNDVLYPRVDDSDAYLLYMGIVNFNFYRLFGGIESTEMIFDILKSKMVGVSSSSVLCYLLIKQIDPKHANSWLTLNTNELISQGWSIEYLSAYILF